MDTNDDQSGPRPVGIRVTRAFVAFVLGLATMVAIGLLAAPDAAAQSSDVRIITAEDTDNNDDPDAALDERVPALVEMFVDGSSTGLTTTSWVGVQPASSHDVLGSPASGSAVIVCQQAPVDHHFILAEIGGAAQLLVADPAGSSRACVSTTAGSSNINVFFLNEENADVVVLTTIDIDINGTVNVLIDERVPAEVELFIDGQSVNTLTTTYTGIENMSSINDVIGTAAEGDVLILCAADIADHVTVAISGASAADPDGLNRTCSTRTIAAGAITVGKSEFFFSYLPNADVVVLTTVDIDINGTVNVLIDERVPAEVELFIDGQSVNTLTTTYTGIENMSSINDVIGTAAEGDVLILCAADIADHVTVAISGASAADPDGLNRTCSTRTIAAGAITVGKSEFFFSYLPNAAMNVLTASDVDRGGTISLSIDERVQAEVELFIDGQSVNTLTTTYTGIENTIATIDNIGTAAEGDEVTVCAADIAGHTTVSVTGSNTTDPDGLNRVCGTFTIPASTITLGKLDFIVEYLPDETAAMNVLTASDNDRSGTISLSIDERVQADVELFVNGLSVNTLTTTYTGIENTIVTIDNIGTAAEGDEVTVCAADIAGHTTVSVTGSNTTDPNGLNRVCGTFTIPASTITLGKLDFIVEYLPDETAAMNVLSASDIDRSGTISLSIDERVQADVELFVNGLSVNTLTTTYTGIENTIATIDNIGTAAEDDEVTVCAADIAGHTTVSVSGSNTTDPDGLNRVCGTYTIPASTITFGKLDFIVNYLPDEDECPTSTPTVNTATELDTAIDCYNTQTPSGNHTISLGSSFSHPGGTPAITQSTTAISLTITSDATQRTITGPGPNSVAGSVDLFAITGAGPVNFDDLTLAGADDNAIGTSGGGVTITDSTLKDSSYGIFASSGTVSIATSTIANNTFDGLGIFGATVTVSNSTITNNDARGIVNGSGAVTVSNSTITNNGDHGIDRFAGSVTVVSTIVANNTNLDCNGSISDGGNNFDSDNTCTGFTALAPVGAGSLGALADNGGPTQTQELLAASNAVDAGKCTGVVVGVDSGGINVLDNLLFDQRVTGFPRSIGICDAGAFEADTSVQFNPLTPSRILDTRPTFASAGNPADGLNVPVGAGDVNVRTVEVADLPLAGVPSNATAVAIHVTSVGPTANSFLTVWPDGTRPNVASKNFGITAGGPFGYAGLTNDLLIVPVGPGGTIQVYNDAGTVDLVIDIVGYYAPTGDRYNPLTPSRILDTRPTFASAGNPADGPDVPVGAGDVNVRTVEVADLPLAGVPSNATAVAIQVTSVGPTANSFLTVWPDGTRPNAASKNFGITAGGPFGYAGLTNDLLIVPVGPGGTIQVYNDTGTVDLVIDVVGYYAPTGDRYKPLFPSRILDTRPTFGSAGNPADGPDVPVGAGDVNGRTVQVADLTLAGVPKNATAVAIQVTSVGPTANSFLTVWPTGTRPNAASKNFGITAGGPFGYAGLTNDLLIVPVGLAGSIQIYNDAGTVDLVIDIVGYTSN